MTYYYFPRARRPPVYPEDWCRRISFLTPMGLEVSQGTGDLQVQYLKVDFSMARGERPRSTTEKTEFGILKKNLQARDRWIWTTRNPPSMERSEEVWSMKELLEDIEARYKLNYHGKFPDAVIKERIIREPMPRNIRISEAPEVLQISEEFISYQKEEANRTKVYRALLRLPKGAVMNPYWFCKYGLLSRRAISKADMGILRKIRGMLRTVSVGTDACGPNYEMIGKDWLEKIELNLTRNFWHWDVGKPIRIQATVDGSKVYAVIYHLLGEKRNIVLPPVSKEF